MALLHRPEFTPRTFDDYGSLVDDCLFKEIRELASRLRGRRVLYLNSNQNRGGVYEHLVSLVPLMRDLGLRAEWLAISEVPSDFYEVTKALYNGLQGTAHAFTDAEWAAYEAFNRQIAMEVAEAPWDVVLVQIRP